MYTRWLFRLALLFLSMLVVISTLYKSMVIEEIYTDVDFTLPPKADTLVVGSSHLQLGFDDTGFTNVINLSNSGMPFYFTYSKIKRLLIANPQVKKLIISFSPIHIAPYGDMFFFSDKGLSRELSFKFYPLLDDVTVIDQRRYSVDFVASYLKYELGVPFHYMEDLKLIARFYLHGIDFLDLDFAGKYNPRYGSYLDPLEVQSKAKFYFSGQNKRSKFALKALNNIIHLANNHELELIVLSMPMHDSFKSHIPKQYLSDYQKLMAKLVEDHEHVRFIDYQHFDLKDSDFYDGDHINIYGVNKLMKEINRDIFIYN